MLIETVNYQLIWFILGFNHNGRTKKVAKILLGKPVILIKLLNFCRFMELSAERQKSQAKNHLRIHTINA